MGSRADEGNDLRDSAEGLGLAGLARRLTVKLSGALWQLLGFKGAYDEEETFPDVEVFQNVGFRSRPKAGSRAEVIVLNLGGEPGNAVVVATRDRSIEVELEEDETAIF